MVKIILKEVAEIVIVAVKSYCRILVLAVMVTVRRGFSAVKNAVILNVVVDFSYKPKFFNILAVGQKYLSFYLPSFFSIHRVNKFEIFLDKQFFS